MKILVMAGHSASGNLGCGAEGYINESNENRKVAPKVVEYLKKLGIEATYIHLDKSKSSKYLKEQVDLANSKGNFDCVVQIHFNAGSEDKTKETTGSETLYITEKGKAFAQRVDDKLSILFKDKRNIRQDNKLFWLRHTKSVAILIEVCFIDDKDDVKVYEENFEEVCKLIAEGLANKDFQEVEEKTTKYRIRTGGFDKERAETKLATLKELTGWWADIEEDI